MGVWGKRADRVIDRVLASLPADMTYQDRERAVRDAYPFGERKHHPYREWLKAVAGRFPKAMRRLPAPGVRVGPHGVLCGWCGRPGGCLVCAGDRHRLAHFAGDKAEWRRLLAAALGDRAARAVLADWLEENGFDNEAQRTRNLWDDKLAKMLLEMEP